MISPIQYFQESQAEIRKVSWPSKKVTFQYTNVVIAISVIAVVILGGLDLLFNYLLKIFIL